MKKIAIVGPECTGKSRLSQNLAEYFKTSWVPEFAREFIERLDRPYNRNDLLTIARGQARMEDHVAEGAADLLFCDTNLLVIKIWSEHKYGQCDPWILEEIQKRKYDLHLLTYIDIPWQDDPQREHPKLRNYFYDVYKKELDNSRVIYTEIRGLGKERLEVAIEVIKSLIQ